MGELRLGHMSRWMGITGVVVGIAAATAFLLGQGSTAPSVAQEGAAFKVPEPALTLQPLGRFHGDEVRPQAGDRWMALSQCGDTLDYGWVPVSVSITMFYDGIVDVEGEMTGKEVGVKQVLSEDWCPAELVKPVILAKGVPGVKPGAVDVSFYHRLAMPRDPSIPRSRHVIQAGPISAAEQGSSTRFEVLPAPKGHGSILTMERNGKRRDLINPSPEGADSIETIVGGDFDGDGHLDLIINDRPHYNVNRWQLWMSRPAGENEFVRPVAEHNATGC